MQIVQINEDLKKTWDEFVASYSVDGGLLQSWQWGDFQKSLENKVIRLGALDNEGAFQGAALLIKIELPFEYNYLYCPRGPVVNTMEVSDMEDLFSEIKQIAKEEKSFLLRVDPAWTLGNEKRLFDAGWRKSEGEVQPKCSMIIDITRSEEEIMSLMKQKTRYNIGLAQKRGVTVRTSSEISDMEAFWQLTKQTSERDGFKSHPKKHYQKMFELFKDDGTIKLFLAEYDNKIVAANMVAFFGRMAVYLHGSSADMYRGMMAPYLLQWQAILEAKKLGFSQYDFGGVNGLSYQNPKWEGITRFKTSFATDTQPKEYVGNFELVINPVIFSAYKFVKQIRG
ncbi:peptidoglycan bridge formation glycyltransferase FemA/FemB family protein [Candidatus Falkowbacteria bacterium]|nr:peptidoglycan bridge formation glycyltransferase FemA/FemB family protein [Candidatus Falkowbacteria bacterium]